MSDRRAPTLPPPLEEAGLSLWLPDFESEVPSLPAPTIVPGPPVADGPLTYGLVAKVALSRPGFGFRIEHDLPPDVEFIEARPKAKVVGEHLIWQLGRVDPGQDIRLEVVVQPQPGAVLNPENLAAFEATYSQNLYFQAPVVRSKLVARWSGPPTVAVGDTTEFTLDVIATGNWSVPNGRVVIWLPTQFEHPDGERFEFDLGTLKPKEYRRIQIAARAVLSGTACLRAEVTGPGDRVANVELRTVVE
ncbi:MAG TPA: hypothetical protein VHR66_27740 [Gemmataceae bacterium]|jgi:hypothetical protein|nr:hypothetical protein [Gemmataceae bacterium]